MKSIFKKIKESYNMAEEYLLIGSLAFTVVLVFIQVFMRKVLNSSLSWSEELCRYIFIWQVWLGSSLAFRDNQHISVEMLRDKFKGRARILFDMLANLITLAFNIFLVVSGLELVQKMIQRGVISSGMRLPLYLVYLSVPLTAFVILFRIVGNLYNDVKKLINYEGAEI